MDAEIHYLTRQQLVFINQYAVEVVGGITYGVQTEAGLATVLEQPKQVVFGHELYPTIWLKAAFILQKITKKHIFVDGNKRTAIQAALFFLYLNDYVAEDNQEINNADKFVLSVTNSNDSEETMVEIAKWLKLNFKVR